ncbi:MAG: hypothetical protein O7B79_06565 [SAR324 cluster bacterium]|nr:hypothetical protein [SAR324 cluster bacterium]
MADTIRSIAVQFELSHVKASVQIEQILSPSKNQFSKDGMLRVPPR